MFDTAQAKEWYNELGVGTAVKAWSKATTTTTTTTTSKSVIVTKIHPRDFEMKRMTKALESSRRRLTNGTEPVDVVLLHAPVCWPGTCTPEEESVTWQTGWKNLEVLSRRGYCRFIGVSNFDVHLLEELFSFATVRVSFLQNWMDPFHQDKETRAFAKRHGIVYMAFSSLGIQWYNSLKRNPVFESEVLQAVAKSQGKSVAQVTYSWVLQSGAAALPRTTNSAHLAELRVFTRTQNRSRLTVFLNAEDMEIIKKLDGSLDKPT